MIFKTIMILEVIFTSVACQVVDLYFHYFHHQSALYELSHEMLKKRGKKMKKKINKK